VNDARDEIVADCHVELWRLRFSKHSVGARLEVTMTGFKTLKRPASVGAGDRATRR
jgi:hypothetical protein